jgi:hypothetical protein
MSLFKSSRVNFQSSSVRVGPHKRIFSFWNIKMCGLRGPTRDGPEHSHQSLRSFRLWLAVTPRLDRIMRNQ